MSARRSLVLGVAVALAAPVRAAEWQPVVRLDASGGQVFFDDFDVKDRSFSNSAAASADWLLAEGISFSSGAVLIPQLSGSYIRRAQVATVGGGSIAVSQTLDNSAALRGVYAFGDWKLKPNASYKSELIAEAAGETLGTGVFDLRQTQAGLEAEWNGQRWKSVRQSFSVGQTQYYHYDPARSPLFGLELLTSRQALDFVSYAYQAAAEYQPWQDGLVSAVGDVSWLQYAHQDLFEGATPTGTKRQDWLGDVFLSAAQRWRTSYGYLSLSLGAGFSELDSNQNNLDVGQSGVGVVANSDYYSYTEYSLAPTLSVSVGGRWKATLNYSYVRRQYRDRPAQDSVGAYESRRVWTQTHTAAATVTRLLGRGWSVTASAGYSRSTSDTAFESFYLYNYSYPYYFLGLGYSL